MTGTRLAAPLLALNAGRSVVEVGLLVSLFFVSQVFLAIPAGRYADRHGLQRPMAFAVVLSLLGCMIGALAPSFVLSCISALFTGGATAISSITLQRYVGRASSGAAELRRVFSWLALGPAAANFLGPLAAGLVIDHALRYVAVQVSYQIAYAVMALLPLLSWWCLRGVAEAPRHPEEVHTGPRLGLWALLKDTVFRRLLGLNLLQQASWDVHAFAVPLLGHGLGLSATVIGLVLACFAVGAGVVRLALPVVAGQLSEQRVIQAAMVLTAVALAVYPFLDSAWAMSLCSSVLGVALGAVQPMVMSLIHQASPPQRQGEILGLRLMAVNATSVAMPLICGALGGAAGVGLALWLTAGLVFTGLLSARRLGAPRQDRADAQD